MFHLKIAIVLISAIFLLETVSGLLQPRTTSLPGNPQIVGGGINSQCMYDADCSDTPYLYCYRNERCQCRRGFREENNRCYANVGADCNNNADCKTLPNSKCDEKICVCSTDYTEDPQGYHCLASVRYGEPCQSDQQCFKYMGNLTSLCDAASKTCTCRIYYHPARNGTCVLSKALGDQCINDDDCYNGGIEANSPIKNTLVCKDNFCTCKEGMVPTAEKFCKSGATSIVFHSFLLFISTMLGVKFLF